MPTDQRRLTAPSAGDDQGRESSGEGFLLLCLPAPLMLRLGPANKDPKTLARTLELVFTSGSQGIRPIWWPGRG